MEENLCKARAAGMELSQRGAGIGYRVPDRLGDGFVTHAKGNLHVKVLYGRSNHHKIEAIFKCWARSMKYACSKDVRMKDQLPSTKELL